jgi:hypothetical protein
MDERVAVILRFDGTASDIVPRWMQAVEFWKRCGVLKSPKWRRANCP